MTIAARLEWSVGALGRSLRCDREQEGNPGLGRSTSYQQRAAGPFHDPGYELQPGAQLSGVAEPDAVIGDLDDHRLPVGLNGDADGSTAVADRIVQQHIQALAQRRSGESDLSGVVGP